MSCMGRRKQKRLRPPARPSRHTRGHVALRTGGAIGLLRQVLEDANDRGLVVATHVRRDACEGSNMW